MCYHNRCSTIIVTDYFNDIVDCSIRVYRFSLQWQGITNNKEG